MREPQEALAIGTVKVGSSCQVNMCSFALLGRTQTDPFISAMLPAVTYRLTSSIDLKEPLEIMSSWYRVLTNTARPSR